MRRFRQWFLDSMSGVKKRLLRHSKPSNLTFIGEELERGEFYPKMVCQKCVSTVTQLCIALEQSRMFCGVHVLNCALYMVLMLTSTVYTFIAIDSFRGLIWCLSRSSLSSLLSQISGSFSVLPPRHIGSGSSQRSASQVHGHCQEPNIHVLSYVQRHADETESRNCALQYGARSYRRPLCEGVCEFSKKIYFVQC